jgi:hypothetical protein
MSQMTGITNANQALAAEDLEGDQFKVVAGKVTLKPLSETPAGSVGGVLAPPVGTPPNAVLNADSSWTVPTAPVVSDFWSSAVVTANTPTPPDGTTDLTERVRREGFIGVAKEPTSSFHGRTLALNSKTTTTNTQSANDNSTVYLGTASTYTLLDPNLYLDRVIHLVNSTDLTLTLGGTHQYLDHIVDPTAFQTTIPPKTYLTLHSTYTSAAPAPINSGYIWVVMDKTVITPASAPLANTLTYDAVGKTITSTVSGVVSTTSLASLDDEGVSLSFAAGSLQLKNAAGTVLSTTPVPDLDAQTLTLTGQTLAISGGNSVTLPAAPAVYSGSVAGIVPAAPAAPLAGKFLQADGTWATPPAPVATTHVNAWTKTGGLTESVDGVTSNIAIPVASPIGSMTDFIGYNAAGTPVNTPVPRTVRIQEEYKAVAASTTHAIIGPNADALYDTYFISTLIEVTAAGVTYTLPVVPLSIGLAIHSIEIDVKTTGPWVGTVSVAAPAGVTIDGAAAYSFTKAAATGVNAQPSRSFRYSLSAGKWLVV